MHVFLIWGQFHEIAQKLRRKPPFLFTIKYLLPLYIQKYQKKIRIFSSLIFIYHGIP
jgi:hypothetical protein